MYISDAIPYCILQIRKITKTQLCIKKVRENTQHFSQSYLLSIYRWIPSSKNWRSLPQSISRCEKTWLGPFFYRMAVLGLEVSTSNLYYSVF